MKFTVHYSKKAQKKLEKLDHYTKVIILEWVNKNLEGCVDPRRIGKALVGEFSGQWRYRIGNYRLICSIEDDKLIITALNIGHRGNVYKK